jgi:hypothetical protein
MDFVAMNWKLRDWLHECKSELLLPSELQS